MADGTTNNIKLPPEIFAEFDGLGMGTKTVKTYYANDTKITKEVKITYEKS
ncbi:MAG: hypothetical protein SPH44_09775 [Eubacteriales bacterium]|nr:hypothetical protein [Eubacteriales bacterium]